MNQGTTDVRGGTYRGKMYRSSVCRGLFGGLLILIGATQARAEVKTQEIEYKQGATALQGFLAYDDAGAAKKPGILVVHEWWGHNQHARAQAERLAKAGYVAFALDMYGKGKVATHPKDAMAFMEEATKDPQVIAARFNAALDLLKQQPQVNPDQIAAVGYCFGGTVSLNMLRAGAPLKAVATFHSGLKPGGAPAEKGKIKASILVQTGGVDPFVPKEQVQAFEKEMKDAGVKVQLVTYPLAKHSFTNPDADKAGMEALAYNADAEKKSWPVLLKFLKPALNAKAPAVAAPDAKVAPAIKVAPATPAPAK